MKIFCWIKKGRALRAAERLAKKGNTQGALEQIESALSDSPNSIDLHIQRSWALADLKRYPEALSAVDTGLNLSRNNGVLLLIKGEILYATGEYDQARQTLHLALEHAGENLRIEYALGLTYVALGDMDKAAHFFESSVRYDKSLVQSRMLAMSERYLFEHRPKHS